MAASLSIVRSAQSNDVPDADGAPPSEPPSLPPGGGGGTYDGMEPRVKKLEDDIGDIKVTLGIMNERLSHLATKADVETLRGEVREVKGTLDGKLNVWQFITLGLTMGALTVGALTLVIRWPSIAAALGI